ncbi:Uncharacterised protein [Vibrio cholerae]|nr:Uncharacterised protein [Vibrio cholerae]
MFYHSILLGKVSQHTYCLRALTWKYDSKLTHKSFLHLRMDKES